VSRDQVSRRCRRLLERLSQPSSAAGLAALLALLAPQLADYAPCTFLSYDAVRALCEMKHYCTARRHSLILDLEALRKRYGRERGKLLYADLFGPLSARRAKRPATPTSLVARMRGHYAGHDAVEVV
jgi:hypothetical protein